MSRPIPYVDALIATPYVAPQGNTVKGATISVSIVQDVKDITTDLTDLDDENDDPNPEENVQNDQKVDNGPKNAQNSKNEENPPKSSKISKKKPLKPLYALYVTESEFSSDELMASQYPGIDWALVRQLGRAERFTGASGSLLVVDKNGSPVIIVAISNRPTLATLRSASQLITKRALASRCQHIIVFYPLVEEVSELPAVPIGFGKGNNRSNFIQNTLITPEQRLDTVIRGLLYPNWSHDLYLQKSAFRVKQITLIAAGGLDVNIARSVDNSPQEKISKGSDDGKVEEVAEGDGGALPTKVVHDLSINQVGKPAHGITLNLAQVAKAVHGAESVSLSRELGSLRFQDATNTYMKDTIVKFAENHADVMKVKVLDREQCMKEGYNLICAVNQGSWDPCYLVAVEYTPPGYVEQEGDAPVAFVAKTVTFDTGGLDIKSPDSMITQHKDKHAGCNQLGAFRYLALTRPRTLQRIIGVWCITDNVVGSRAIHPHSIIMTRSVNNSSRKISVAIDNTDAEGRLALADGVTFVQDYYKPSRITTTATLTGAIKNALGSYLTGLFTNSPYQYQPLMKIGELNKEPFWLMPLLRENINDIAGDDCDLRNMGKKFMGASNAAAFIDSFVGNGVEFFHWDIAGVSAQPNNPAAGVPVATLQHYMDSFCQE